MGEGVLDRTFRVLDRYLFMPLGVSAYSLDENSIPGDRMQVNDIVQDCDGDRGVIVEIYRGPKIGMIGRVKVSWIDSGEWTWEYMDDLSVIK